MATVIQHRVNVQVETKIVLELSESEARALDGIFGYNVDVFLKVFYERMGRHYVEPHEAAVRALHSTIRGALSPALDEIVATRRKIQQALRPTSQ